MIRNPKILVAPHPLLGKYEPPTPEQIANCAIQIAELFVTKWTELLTAHRDSLGEIPLTDLLLPENAAANYRWDVDFFSDSPVKLNGSMFEQFLRDLGRNLLEYFNGNGQHQINIAPDLRVKKHDAGRLVLF